MIRNGKWSYKKVQWNDGKSKEKINYIYKIIEEFKYKYRISDLCKLLKITRSSYYRWVSNGKKDYIIKIDINIAKEIKFHFFKYKGIYGSPRITICLKNKGIKISQNKVARIMRIYKMYSVIRVKKMIRKPKEKKSITHGPNIVNRKWEIYEKNEFWVTDITYLPLNNKFAYLSILKDVKTGFIVGYKLSKINDIKIYRDTLINSTKYRNDISKSLIIHSDNGSQYTSFFAKNYSKKNNIIISLSRPGNSIDNAMCETFFSSLKEEWKKELKVNSFEKLESSISKYIHFYNYERIRVKTSNPPSYEYFNNWNKIKVIALNAITL
ncbi:IS3 family transposase [Spiroplasma endosymbiont of Cantharis nigra]|uniref:IS3 family transposase n=1 Tax=Spiroplasma endosymbiont of Cantharis nigra TaxID=3066278 RepID=UPI0030D211BD